MTDQRKSQTVLGRDSRMCGDLVLESDAIIEGAFEGNLHVTGGVEVPAEARVCGLLAVGRLRLAGKAEADVVATESVELLAGSEMTGRIFTPNLTMGHGVIFAGEACIGPQAVAEGQHLLDQAPALAGASSITSPPPVDESAVEPELGEIVEPTLASAPHVTLEDSGGPEPTGADPAEDDAGLSQAPPERAEQTSGEGFENVLESVQRILARHRPRKGAA